MGVGTNTLGYCNKQVDRKVSDLIKKLEIVDPTDHEETDSKKDKNDNKEINNDENDNQKKETKIDENQEMSIDTSLIDLDNLASENDKETNEVEMDDSSTSSEKRGRTQNNFGDKKYILGDSV